MAFQEIAIQFGVAAGRWLISKWLGGGAKPRPPEPGTIEVPTTQEGSALSLVYGTRRLAGNVVAVGRTSAQPRLFTDETGNQHFLGFKFRVAFQMVFGQSNATPTYGAQAVLLNLYAGDRRVLAQAVLAVDDDLAGGAEAAPAAGGGAAADLDAVQAVQGTAGCR